MSEQMVGLDIYMTWAMQEAQINTSAFEICKENVEFTYIIEELVIYNQSNFQNYVYNIQSINSF